jgi:uncharacterized LabA/DUF88 family protein
MNREKIYAFIDSQNLNLGVSTDVKRNGKTIYSGWKLDFKQFYTYLKDAHRVSHIFLFIGYRGGNEALYTMLQKCGYICVFKPTLDVNGVIKGNCDAELVLHTMIEFQNYDKAIIVSGDGDFHCLVEYLEENNKLKKILIPNKFKFSSLLTKYNQYFEYVSQLKSRLEKAKAPI